MTAESRPVFNILQILWKQ